MLYSPEDCREQLFRYRNFGHLKNHITGMTDDLRADLDQLLPQSRHRPVAYGFWQSSLTEEVPEVVRKDKELQTDMIISITVSGDYWFQHRSPVLGAVRIPFTEQGKFDFQPSVEIESKGMLWDMWEAMVYLKNKHSDLITSLDCFPLQDDRADRPSFNLVTFKPFEANESADEITRNWVYLDPLLKLPRGVLIARLVVRGQAVYIVEIQRRIKGDTFEEHFPGMVFILDDERYLSSWVHQLLDNIRHVHGRMRKLRSRCPGTHFVFTHRKSKDNQVNCMSTVKWALKQVGHQLKE